MKVLSSGSLTVAWRSPSLLPKDSCLTWWALEMFGRQGIVGLEMQQCDKGNALCILSPSINLPGRSSNTNKRKQDVQKDRQQFHLLLPCLHFNPPGIKMCVWIRLVWQCMEKEEKRKCLPIGERAWEG